MKRDFGWLLHSLFTNSESIKNIRGGGGGGIKIVFSFFVFCFVFV